MREHDLSEGEPVVPSKPNLKLHELRFSGALLARGFWVYVWEIEHNHLRHYYVGRTGDSSSSHAQSPIGRLSGHLGSNKKSNALRRHLLDAKIDPTQSQFRLLACGPLYAEQATTADHKTPRDIVAAYEKALAEELGKAGCDVLNVVRCKKTLNEAGFAEVCATFAPYVSAIKLGPTRPK